jgi:hypothetical protein
MLGRKGSVSNQLISNAVPRFDVFKLSDTVLEIKMKLYEKMKHMFTVKDEINEEWVNENIIVWIKDNTPSGRHKKAECEFCGRCHTTRDDICDIRTESVDSGNTMEGVKLIKLQDIYDMVKSKREIVFQVMINAELERSCNIRGL